MESKDEASDTDSGIILQSGEWSGPARLAAEGAEAEPGQGGGWRGDHCWDTGRAGEFSFLGGLAWSSDPIWNR